MQPTQYVFASRRPKPAPAPSSPQEHPDRQDRPAGQRTRQGRSEPIADRRTERAEQSQDRRRSEAPRSDRQRPASDRSRSDHASRADAMRSDRSREPRRDRPGASSNSTSRVESPRTTAPTRARPYGDRPRDADRSAGSHADRMLRDLARSGAERRRPAQQPSRPLPPVLSTPLATTGSHVQFREVPPSAELTSFAELTLRPETR